MHILSKHCDNQIDLVCTTAEEVACSATGATVRLEKGSTGALVGVYTVEAYVPVMEPAKQKVRGTARNEEFD
jgi:hypothetical protein